MAQLREKKQKEEWIRGKTYESKSGEKITVLHPWGKEWLKILNSDGKLELITKAEFSGRLGYGQQNTDNIRHGY